MLNKTGLDKKHKVLGAKKWNIIRSADTNTFASHRFPANDANAWAIGTNMISRINQGSKGTRIFINMPDVDPGEQSDRIKETKIPSGLEIVCYLNLNNYTPDFKSVEQSNRIRELLNNEDPETQPATLDSEDVQVQNLREQYLHLKEWFGWSSDENPQTQPATLDSEDVQVQELIYRFKRILSIPYRQKLAERLLSLFNNAKEEDPNSLGIAVGSLRGFYDFLRLHNNLKYPSILLTPDEDIYAKWEGDQNRLFSIHFLSNRDVSFVVFKPDRYNPERITRLSGTTTTDTLMDDIFSDSLDWITE